MPNISINKSDLQDLGISLKDILLAITKSKHSDSDVIKIKRKKPKNNRKRNQKPKQMSSTFVKYSQTGGGVGSASIYNPSPMPPIVTNVMTSGSTDKDNQINSIKNQIEDFKRDNEMKLITQQNQMTNFQNMNHLGLRLIYNKLENPLTNINSINFREPPAVDRTDRFGIIPTTNFYDDTNRIQIIEEIPTTEQEQVVINQTPIPEIQPQDPIEQPSPFETALEQEVQKEKKKSGRPKGSRNKAKEPSPLTQEAIAQEMELPNTRSTNNILTNPEMATPDRFAREQMKKQETISNFFTPRKVAGKKPIQNIPESDFETESNPTSEISKNKSRLPLPTRIRSRSENSGIVLG